METKLIFGTVKAIGGKDDPFDISVVCSTEVMDRAGEVIHQDGWILDDFKANPVFLAAHMHRSITGQPMVIGSFKDIGVKQSCSLDGDIKFASTTLGKEYATLYGEKHMRAVSVGFDPVRQELRKDNDTGKMVMHYLEQKLIEVSAVAVGCNQEALAKSFGMGHLAEKDLLTTMIADAVKASGEKMLIDIKAFLQNEFDEFVSQLPENGFLKGAMSGGSDHACGHENGITAEESAVANLFEKVLKEFRKK